MKALVVVLFTLLTVASFACAILFLIKNRRKSGKSMVYIFAAACLLFLVLDVFIGGGINQIDAGEIGVLKVYGQAREVKQPGLAFVNIATTKIDIYDTKVREINSDIEAYSFDAQSMTANVKTQYSIQTDKALDIARNYGGVEPLESRISAIIIERTKTVLSSKSGMSLIESRSTLSSNVEGLVRTALANYPVTVSVVAITDITFNEAFESAVEQKMIAEQQKLKAEYDKETAIIKAEQDRETATIKAEADLAVAVLNARMALTRAQGEADAAVAAAKGQAQALKAQTIEVARMLGFTIIDITQEIDGEQVVVGAEIDTTGKTGEEIQLIAEYIKYIKYLETWDGQLPDVVAGDDFQILFPYNPQN
jgi:Membrane protease subunits, stomatin/prohibitin homologs